MWLAASPRPAAARERDEATMMVPSLRGYARARVSTRRSRLARRIRISGAACYPCTMCRRSSILMLSSLARRRWTPLETPLSRTSMSDDGYNQDCDSGSDERAPLARNREHDAKRESTQRGQGLDLGATIARDHRIKSFTKDATGAYAA